jgi:hypothetical protein
MRSSVRIRTVRIPVPALTELEAANLPSPPDRTNARTLFDGHPDNREFGYRCLVDEARDAGVAMAERTA